MNHHLQHIAIILAAGSGSRFGAELPKQFCLLNGRPLLMTTIDAFSQVISPTDTYLVMAAEMVPLWQQLCNEYGFSSPHIIHGGNSRWQSVKNAIDLLSQSYPPSTVALIHDGARPFPSRRLITDACALDSDEDMLVSTVKVTDSLRYIIPNGCSEAVDRSRYVAVQTPQSARLNDLKQAYELPYRPDFTDDASVMEAAGMGRIRLIEGEYTNIKITNPLDIKVAEAILSARSNRST